MNRPALLLACVLAAAAAPAAWADPVEATKKGVERAASATGRGLHKAEGAVKKGLKKAEQGVQTAGQATGKAVEKAASKVGLPPGDAKATQRIRDDAEKR